jgi:hypothetical protein
MKNNGMPNKGYFNATLENAELNMRPHCACGNPLPEDYYCEKCQKQCRCTEIRCKDKAAFDYVNGMLTSNKRFHNFTAVLDKE